MYISYLTILLETFGPLAFASHTMRTRWSGCLSRRRDGNSRLKGIWILGTSVLHGLGTDILMRLGVVTVTAVASIAIQFSGKAFAIQFETLRLFAVARIPLGGRCHLFSCCRWCNLGR